MPRYLSHEELEDAWRDVSVKWTAEAKVQYQRKIFSMLVSEATEIHKRNEALERYADNCIKFDIGKEYV